MNFQPIISIEIQLLKVTFISSSLISIADRNVVRQAEFCFLNFADLVQLM